MMSPQLTSRLLTAKGFHGRQLLTLPAAQNLIGLRHSYSQGAGSDSDLYWNRLWPRAVGSHAGCPLCTGYSLGQGTCPCSCSCAIRTGWGVREGLGLCNSCSTQLQRSQARGLGREVPYTKWARVWVWEAA